VAEMLYGLVYGQQLVVLCAIFSADPCWVSWRRRRGFARCSWCIVAVRHP
jgi:hypothetical protein